MSADEIHPAPGMQPPAAEAPPTTSEPLDTLDAPEVGGEDVQGGKSKKAQLARGLRATRGIWEN